MNEATLPTPRPSIAEGPPRFSHHYHEAVFSPFETVRKSDGYPQCYRGKRLLDVLVAGTALLLLSPLFLLITLVIVLESRGPVFYVAQRMGSRYQIFNFYKFRTMAPGADQLRNQLRVRNQYDLSFHYTPLSSPFFFKVSDDPRVTRVGKFLRKTSLDELPQLLNVLKGDMSLVGNRPLPLDEAATLMNDCFADRFLAPAGVTGLWQIAPHKDAMGVADRIRLDLRYARECSPILDGYILWKTLPAMLQKG